MMFMLFLYVCICSYFVNAIPVGSIGGDTGAVRIVEPVKVIIGLDRGDNNDQDSIITAEDSVVENLKINSDATGQVLRDNISNEQPIIEKSFDTNNTTPVNQPGKYNWLKQSLCEVGKIFLRVVSHVADSCVHLFRPIIEKKYAETIVSVTNEIQTRSHNQTALVEYATDIVKESTPRVHHELGALYNNSAVIMELVLGRSAVTLLEEEARKIDDVALKEGSLYLLGVIENYYRDSMADFRME